MTFCENVYRSHLHYRKVSYLHLWLSVCSTSHSSARSSESASSQRAMLSLSERKVMQTCIASNVTNVSETATVLSALTQRELMLSAATVSVRFRHLWKYTFYANLKLCNKINCARFSLQQCLRATCWWRGLAVTRWSRSTKLLYAGPG